MKVKMIAHTPNPEELIARGYGICTNKVVPVENIPGLIAKGHLSPVEHASATFEISGISRACSHQLVRHRLASYSQESQRYCTQSEWEAVDPPRSGTGNAQWVFDGAIEVAKNAYELLLDLGVPEEDARFVLPNATPTKILVTMNFRSWLHFIAVRATQSAQWEIREVAYAIESRLHEIAPHVFS